MIARTHRFHRALQPRVRRPVLAALLGLVPLACGTGTQPGGVSDANEPGPFAPVNGDSANGASGSLEPESGAEPVSAAEPVSGAATGAPGEENPMPPAVATGGAATGDVDTVGDPAPEPAFAGNGPVGCDAAPEAMRERALQLINTVRAEARACGSEAFAATGPLDWNAKLRDAAAAHSADMATHNFFDHTGSDGGSVTERVDAAGYGWSHVGENIAGGQRSVAEAVDGWVASPGHCRNLMNPDYSVVALACVAADGTDYGTYWTNVFARPR